MCVSVWVTPTHGASFVWNPPPAVCQRYLLVPRANLFLIFLTMLVEAGGFVLLFCFVLFFLLTCLGTLPKSTCVSSASKPSLRSALICVKLLQIKIMWSPFFLAPLLLVFLLCLSVFLARARAQYELDCNLSVSERPRGWCPLVSWSISIADSVNQLKFYIFKCYIDLWIS